MSNQTPAPETVIRRALESAMKRISTAEPGIIEAYNATTCTADVQPLVMRVRLDESGERVVQKSPVITDVPVYFSGGGGMRLTFPVKKGDQCLLITSSQPLDQWHSTGALTDPKTTRHHHISDSIALVGLAPAYKATAANADATILEGSDIRLGDDTAVALATKADVQALRDHVNTFITTIYNSHVHGGVATGGGSSSPPGVSGTSPGNPSGTSKVKGK